MAAIAKRLLNWGAASAPLAGQVESGDLHLVKPFENGALVAVVDGLGHGAEAAIAARTAIDILEKHPSESVINLVNRCHKRLHGTRGVVMSLAAFDARERTMTWLGVGNVEGTLLHADADGKPAYESLIQRRGVVGGRLPTLNAMIVPVARGDTLILVTDGIRSGFEPGASLRASPKRAAEEILRQHSTGTDDALVLVARYHGKRT